MRVDSSDKAIEAYWEMERQIKETTEYNKAVFDNVDNVVDGGVGVDAVVSVATLFVGLFDLLVAMSPFALSASESPVGGVVSCCC